MNATQPNTPELFGASYKERRYDGRTQQPCARCGKPVNTNRDHWVVNYNHQGWFAIGSECRKFFPNATRVPA